MMLTTAPSRTFASRVVAVKPIRKAPIVAAASGQINPDIKKDNPKVVDDIVLGDDKPKVVLCRCWRSATFPLCNGAHVKHNEATGDNVGPAIVSVKK